MINNNDDLAHPIGGRVRHVSMGPREYEIGGSIIHSANKYMVRYLQECGLQKKEQPPDAPFSLHKDEDIVFQVFSNYG